jgi:hypothetical protein
VSSEKNIGFTVPPKDNQFRNVLFRHTYFSALSVNVVNMTSKNVDVSAASFPTQGLVGTLQFILSSRKINQTHPMLIVGQRTNVKHVSAENASSHENIIKIIAFLIYSHYSEH